MNDEDCTQLISHSHCSHPCPHHTGELGYDGPLYARLSAMTDNMLGPSPMHIKYVYWTMCRPDSVCRSSATMDQYHGTHDAIYDVISIEYAGQTRV